MKPEGGVKMMVENKNTEEWTLHSIYRNLPTYNTIRQEGKDDLLSFKPKVKTILCVFLYIFTHKQTKTRKGGVRLCHWLQAISGDTIWATYSGKKAPTQLIKPLLFSRGSS